MGMPGGNPSIKMVGMVSRFQYGYNNFMLAEAQEEYLIASSG